MRSQLQEAAVVDCRLGPDDETLAEDVLDGLTRPFKELPPKHFYDERGSQLFDRICTLPEYYPTRTERAILARHAGEIADTTGARELVELGAGYATKTRVLLDAIAAAGSLERYLPVDVCTATVHDCARRICDEYPGIRVHGVVGDFERHLRHLPPANGPRLVAFLGGTIGNLTPGRRRRFLRGAAQLLNGGWLLLGTDLVKAPAVLEAAYNDSAGVTAEFNRNVLRVVNRELRARFPVERFQHVAFYDHRHQWIEMRLRAPEPMRVAIEAIALEVDFAAGEEIRTEISAKFTEARLERELAGAGLRLEALYTDPDRLFALSLARAPQAPPPS